MHGAGHRRDRLVGATSGLRGGADQQHPGDHPRHHDPSRPSPHESTG